MSVCKDNSRKQYYISYRSVDEATGVYKTYNIRNAEWTFARGKKFVQRIENDEIYKDKLKRKNKVTASKVNSLEKLISDFTLELETTVKQSTCYSKKLIINKYIVPFFRIDRDVSEVLTISAVSEFRKYVSQLNLTSNRHFNFILHTLKELIEFGIDRDVIEANQGIKLARILKNITSANVKKEKIVYWTNEEWDKFYNTFSDSDKFKMLFRVDYECALRIGELLALTWNDVDFDRNLISVNKSYDAFGNVTSTKTASSFAEVSISQSLCDALKQYKIDTAGFDDDWVFFADHHTSRTTIRRIMDEHIKLANVPDIKFHGLRHSCASRMINAGCDALLVSKHLRHSSTQMTLDTYSHLFPSRTKGLVDKIFD